MPITLIAGGTGLIGARLSALLKEELGHQVRHLSRKENLHAPYPAYRWDLDAGELDIRALEGASYVINLAGAGVADKPWTMGRKQLITSSRVDSALLLRDAIQRMQDKPMAYLSSAAIGYYGNRGDEWMTEDSAPGTAGFLSESCIAWEQAIQAVAQTGVRTVAMRIGIVLSTAGGALPKLLMPLKFRLAPYFAHGGQWYSWIHIEDLCRMFLFAMEHETVRGPLNAVAPHPVTNKELMQALVRANGYKALISPTPALALRAGLGEMADTVLHSTRVSAAKSEELGFQFRFPEVETALQDLLSRQI